MMAPLLIPLSYQSGILNTGQSWNHTPFGKGNCRVDPRCEKVTQKITKVVAVQTAAQPRADSGSTVLDTRVRLPGQWTHVIFFLDPFTPRPDQAMTRQRSIRLVF